MSIIDRLTDLLGLTAIAKEEQKQAPVYRRLPDPHITRPRQPVSQLVITRSYTEQDVQRALAQIILPKPPHVSRPMQWLLMHKATIAHTLATHLATLCLPLCALFLLWRLILAHLAIVNDGSPTPDTAHKVSDVTLSQAFYGRLAAGGTDYYRCDIATPTTTPLSMLVPQHHYATGFRTIIRLSGPALPAEGLLFLPGDYGTRMGTTAYQRTQRTDLVLQPGSYLLEVFSDQPGVYCLCMGQREPTVYADATTRARVQALLEC